MSDFNWMALFLSSRRRLKAHWNYCFIQIYVVHLAKGHVPTNMMSSLNFVWNRKKRVFITTSNLHVCESDCHVTSSGEPQFQADHSNIKTQTENILLWCGCDQKRHSDSGQSISTQQGKETNAGKVQNKFQQLLCTNLKILLFILCRELERIR